MRVANAVVPDTTVRIPTDDPSNLALAPLRRSSRSASVSSGWGVITALFRTAQQANGFALLGMVMFDSIGGAFVLLSVVLR